MSKMPSEYWTDKELQSARMVRYVKKGVSTLSPIVFRSSKSAESYAKSFRMDGVPSYVILATRELIDSTHTW